MSTVLLVVFFLGHDGRIDNRVLSYDSTYACERAVPMAYELLKDHRILGIRCIVQRTA